MPGPKTKSGLGRSLIRAQERQHGIRQASGKHTTDLGPSAGGPMISVTENTSLEEFLSNAEASQRSFEAERGKVNIVGADGAALSDEENDHDDQHNQSDEEGDSSSEDGDNQDKYCSIPKKPDWRKCSSSEEYHRKEQIYFLGWKKWLHKTFRNQGGVPPYEKNLEFWRQFWKMIEISDIVVQVVDARNPLFFFSKDLADYVKEVSDTKATVILLNKADFLTCEQRMSWCQYFLDSDMKTIYFSATLESSEADLDTEDNITFNTPRILSPAEVLTLLHSEYRDSPSVTIGFLGYPNVGKSSTINRFLTNKKLQVSATPGKTKHYQTHVLDGEVKLVDGPGLVIPNLNMTKAAMVLSGILPIDNLTDPIPSVDLLLSKIPFAYILQHYGIMKSCIEAARKTDRKNPSMQILSSLALMRGFMKPGGVPDQFRAAKILLKDFVQGKLLYVDSPPGTDQEGFCNYTIAQNSNYDENEDEMSLEESFPELRAPNGIHIRGVQAINANDKGNRRLANKKRKEKARRVFKENPYGV